MALGFLGGAMAGLGQGMQMQGAMYNKKALAEAEHERKESLLRLGIQLQEESTKKMDQYAYEQTVSRAPALTAIEAERSRALGEVTTELEVDRTSRIEEAKLNFLINNQDKLFKHKGDLAKFEAISKAEGVLAAVNSSAKELDWDESMRNRVAISMLTGMDMLKPDGVKTLSPKDRLDAYLGLVDEFTIAVTEEHKGLFKKTPAPEEIRAEAERRATRALGSALIESGVAEKVVLAEIKDANIISNVFVEAKRDGLDSSTALEIAREAGLSGASVAAARAFFQQLDKPAPPSEPEKEKEETVEPSSPAPFLRRPEDRLKRTLGPVFRGFSMENAPSPPVQPEPRKPYPFPSVSRF